MKKILVKNGVNPDVLIIDNSSIDTFETIKIDGALASVWTPYKFYSGATFSHCGANSFQLVKIDGAWKIQYIIDTRRKGCK